MISEAQLHQQLALQQLETELLLGVDFIPRTPDSSQPSEPRIAPDPAEKKGQLQALMEQVIAEFPLCDSLSDATQPVFGEGSETARLMFIGEAPGAEEDKTGRPFVGAAGQKLDQMITAMGLDRTEVFITNILKARPPGNRTPTQEEVDASAPYLMRQIEIIQPEVIVTLGGPSTKFILQCAEGITRIRGRWATYETETARIPVMPTFHPAYLLRNYTRDTRQQMWGDLRKVMEVLGLQPQQNM
jgi:uracil-DNA glycosylase family 4